MVSPLPFLGPVGAVRIGRVDGEFVVNPTLPVVEEESTLDLIVVGTKDALTMIEAGADEIPEDEILEAFELAHAEIVKICDAQEDLRRQAGKPKYLDPELTAELESQHAGRIRERIEADGLREAGAVVEELVDELASALSMESGEEDILRQIQVRVVARRDPRDARAQEVVERHVREQFEDDLRALTEAEQDSKELKSAKRQLLFDRIIEEVELPFPVGPATVDGEGAGRQGLADEAVRQEGRRVDLQAARPREDRGRQAPPRRPRRRGRPRGHLRGRRRAEHARLGALHSRPDADHVACSRWARRRRASGSTTSRWRPIAATCTTTTSRRTRSGRPASCAGPKRRDIGHGALAQRALEPMLPPLDEFPYTIRIVSETLESNGSSSMGSVCGSTLALMDAGVPIKAPVGGIAMGLVKEGDDYVILTDIQGAEDHLGDMDFKVAGSRDGITALQMDIKITGVTQEIMRNALEQAKQAREFILDKMAEAISETRTELADHAPRISTVKIDPEQIGMVIGKGGETIRSLEADYEVQIDIEEDGTILIYATEGKKANAAIEAIESITKEPEVGDTYTGKVVKTTDFGAFVELKKGTDGLLHVSNVGPGRVGHIEDVISRGDVLDVIVQEVDKERGRIGLKLVAKHENGTLVQPDELIERAKDAPPRERSERPPRRDGGGRGPGQRPRPRRIAASDAGGAAGAAPPARASRQQGGAHARRADRVVVGLGPPIRPDGCGTTSGRAQADRQSTRPRSGRSGVPPIRWSPLLRLESVARRLRSETAFAADRT